LPAPTVPPEKVDHHTQRPHSTHTTSFVWVACEGRGCRRPSCEGEGGPEDGLEGRLGGRRRVSGRTTRLVVSFMYGGKAQYHRPSPGKGSSVVRRPLAKPQASRGAHAGGVGLAGGPESQRREWAGAGCQKAAAAPHRQVRPWPKH
jgi:hypothetical protein